MINSYQVIQNLSILQCMWNQSEEQIFVFRIKLFSYLISKTFVYKITWYHEVFQIITHQGRGTNLIFLQGYLESTACKRISLCFDFSYLGRERERARERARERERGEDWYDKVNFLKIYFFHFQSAKVLNILRSLNFQNLWAKKKLVNYYVCAWFNDGGLSLVNFL